MFQLTLEVLLMIYVIFIIFLYYYVSCTMHISWHEFVSNDEVLSRSGLFDVSYIVRKRRLGLFGHVARL